AEKGALPRPVAACPVISPAETVGLPGEEGPHLFGFRLDMRNFGQLDQPFALKTLFRVAINQVHAEIVTEPSRIWDERPNAAALPPALRAKDDRRVIELAARFECSRDGAGRKALANLLAIGDQLIAGLRLVGRELLVDLGQLGREVVEKQPP